MSDPFEIPPFLRLTAEERKAGWVGIPLTHWRGRNPKRDYDMPRSLDAAGRTVLKQERVRKAARKAERLARLKELRK